MRRGLLGERKYQEMQRREIYSYTHSQESNSQPKVPTNSQELARSGKKVEGGKSWPGEQHRRERTLCVKILVILSMMWVCVIV